MTGGSPTVLQWESQDSTTASSKKGQSITRHVEQQRTTHLFVRYTSHQTFVYLGPVSYLDHKGEAPMRVRLELQQPLPEGLQKLWS